MKVIPIDIPDVLLLEPRIFPDDRGFFLESYSRRVLADLGIAHEFVQDNHSRSVRNVLRGLHYQIHHAQGKLVRVVIGEIFDVAVDLRRSSPTFGQWTGFHLSADNRRVAWIPPGFAHGFLAIRDADVLYKATDYYSAKDERTILWNDADIAIKWPLNGIPILSPKDAAGLAFTQAECYT